MLGDSGERDPSRFQVQKKENVIGRQAAPGEHFDGKEIDSSQDRHVRANEIRPRRLLASFRSRSNPEST
jgi:hypothetical protein